MNNIVSVNIERANNTQDMIYRLKIEHLDENLYSTVTEIDFEDIYRAFEHLNNIKTN